MFTSLHFCCLSRGESPFSKPCQDSWREHLLGSNIMPYGLRLSEREWQAIVYGAAEILFASNVALGTLDGCVAEKKLDLFQLATSGVAQAGARPPLMPHAA